MRPTRLAWRVVERLRGGCLVEVDMETGFLHQVRVTLAHLGAPLAGDRVYGPAPEADPSGGARHMLHAASLEWEEIRPESPDPPGQSARAPRLCPTD
ncbi:MAG: RNA pseudouridine synthase [Deltaproteobacteria bacterium]|nr:RNA pseudouridine synthase [Deltaproteobacteria bacterium]